MRVLVTGANGYLGSALVAALAEAGHDVSGSARDPSELPAAVRGPRIALGDPCDPRWFAGCDTIVHGAHDMTRGARERNVRGTQQIVDAAAEAGVGQQILLGSYSAHANAAGEYGEAKWELERDFLARDLTVLRPGLVIGPGGIFRRIHDLARRLRVLPLIDGGRGEVPVLAMRDFLTSLRVAIERRVTGRHSLHHPAPVSLARLMRRALETSGSRAWALPVPYGLAAVGVFGLEQVLGSRAPLRLDSLRGFRANQAVQEASQLLEFVGEPTDFDTMLADALEAPSPR